MSWWILLGKGTCRLLEHRRASSVLLSRSILGSLEEELRLI